MEWNNDFPPRDKWPEKETYPKVPTLFDERQTPATPTAAGGPGKSKFDVFNRKDALDHFFVPATTKGEDADVRDAAAP